MVNKIFNIQSQSQFQEAALETFRYQCENVEVYRRFVNFLKISPDEVREVEKIPFLPIEMFKNQLVIDGNFKTERYFQSSGTTQMLNRSKHFIANFGLYEESIYRSFEQFIGKPDDYIFLGLLPNYSENPNSSLIYMVDYLMKKSGKPENGYFLYNHAELLELLKTLKGKKVILFGVSFALLDFVDFWQAEFSETSHSPLHVFTDSLKIIETGGMKGRKEEMTKDELLAILKNGYGTEQIFSEYSMTELLSQAYSLGENIYETPNWMRVLIRSTEDPFSYVKDGRNGAINIIDLANRHSCAFIATQDLGSVRKLETKTSIHPAFSVAGRIDHSDIRGCSLLIS